MDSAEPKLGLLTRFVLALVITAAAGGITWWGYRGYAGRMERRERKAAELIARTRAETYERGQKKLRAMLQNEEILSSLDGLRLELTAKQAGSDRVSLTVKVVKPWGKTWVVESPMHHCRLLLNGADPIALGKPPEYPGTLAHLTRYTNSYAFNFDVDLAIADPTRLVAEWRQHNPRTKAAEILRSNEAIVEKGEEH